MSFIERYWPSLVAAPVVVVTAIWLFPRGNDEQLIHELPSDVQVSESESGQEEAEPGFEAEEQGRQGEPGEVLEPSLPQPRTELRKTLVLVDKPAEIEEKEYSENSPEVKQALAQVKVELFGTASCAHCRKAREFMRANGISFSDHDVDSSPMLKERARRLSGSGAVPVIVIDGSVMTGFSVSGFQSRLTQALKKRVGAQ